MQVEYLPMQDTDALEIQEDTLTGIKLGILMHFLFRLSRAAVQP